MWSPTHVQVLGKNLIIMLLYSLSQENNIFKVSQMDR
jgi:hypothetical protein